MARVICSLPNASHNINGHKFQAHPDKVDHVISDEMPSERAKAFAGIPGFEVVGMEEEIAGGVAMQGHHLKGPAGDLHVAGDLSPADLGALRAHWERGAIEMPAYDTVGGTEAVEPAAVDPAAADALGETVRRRRGAAAV